MWQECLRSGLSRHGRGGRVGGGEETCQRSQQAGKPGDEQRSTNLGGLSLRTLHSRRIPAPTHASSLPQREGAAQPQRGWTCPQKGMSVDSCTRNPKHSRQDHQLAIEGRRETRPASAPYSPKRRSTVHTSARRPPGAGETRSGALQERPARKSRACTYSRPSALA